MPETTIATEAQAATAEAARPAETPEQTIAALRDALAKADGEAKDNRLKAAELDKIKAAQMSDLERVTAERDQFQKDLEAERSAALRWRVAAANGISTEDAEAFLTGSDEETLAKQAARLAALAGTRPGTPKPDLTQGMQGTPTQKTTADMFADFFHSNMN